MLKAGAIIEVTLISMERFVVQTHYTSFLDYRAAQRRLMAKFSDPHRLLLHTLAFVTAVTTFLAVSVPLRLWYDHNAFYIPAIVGTVWSVLLALHALIHYRRSAARAERRELAVEDEMRQLMESGSLDDQALFDTHHSLESDLERQSRWSRGLVAFAGVNLLSWLVSDLTVGTSWPYQMTLPIAVLVIGGFTAFSIWQQARRDQRPAWLARLPVRHIVIYGMGAFVLGLLGMFRAINDRDATLLIVGWFVLVMLNIFWSVIAHPLIDAMMRRFQPQPEKRKPDAQLVLADDGEVVEIAEIEPEKSERMFKLET